MTDPLRSWWEFIGVAPRAATPAGVIDPALLAQALRGSKVRIEKCDFCGMTAPGGSVDPERFCCRNCLPEI